MTIYEVDNSIFRNSQLGYGQEGTPTSQYAKAQSPVGSTIIDYARKAIDQGRKFIDNTRKAAKSIENLLIPEKELVPLYNSDPAYRR